MEPDDQTPLSSAAKAPARRRSASTVVGAALGALVAVFAVLNAQSVDVNWIAASTRTPLIVVIVLFLLIGFAAGVLFRGPRRGRR
jgi:uncharacterized integral membrane protein